jgi:hypothetical protein
MLLSWDFVPSDSRNGVAWAIAVLGCAGGGQKPLIDGNVRALQHQRLQVRREASRTFVLHSRVSKLLPHLAQSLSFASP